MRNSWIPAIAAVALLAGCGGNDADSSGDTQAAPKNVDACGLLSDTEVTAAIGQHGPGQQESVDASAPVCRWAGGTGAVSLTIGSPNTAPNGKLPDPPSGFTVKPGPDGTRFSMPGTAEFSASNRLNFVVVSKGGGVKENDLNNAAATLARAVSAKLGK